MADVWPIENIWSIIKDKVAAGNPKTKPQLMKMIIKAWKDISSNKKLCRDLIKSTPTRLEAVIRKEGVQIRKEDYH